MVAETRTLGSPPLQVHMFSCLRDNYGFLVHDPVTGATAAIDTPDAAVIEQALAACNWQLTHIFNTHHHFDHAGGNAALKASWNAQVIGAEADRARLPGLDQGVKEGDRLQLGELQVEVLEVPGHTSGHIAFYFPHQGVAFVGDALFVLGCGRLFEGTPAQMWQSLSKLMQLPDDTLIYCAHEYTQSNARFALTVDPDNQALRARASEIDQLRAADKPTVPTSLQLEKATNPFLRVQEAALQAQVELVGEDPVTVFAEVRRRKDNF